MRRVLTATLTALLLSAATFASAAERPPASRVPAEATFYAEVNLGQLSGETPVGMALQEALARSQLLETVRAVLKDAPSQERSLDAALGLANTAAEALGPRLGWGFFLGDLGAQLMSGGTPEPKFLLVADVKDAAALDRLMAAGLKLLGEKAPPAVEQHGAQLSTFAGEKLGLARGKDWIALGSPASLVASAAELSAAGDAGDVGGLAASAHYRSAVTGLPADALLTEYVSGSVLMQFSSVAALAAPTLPLPAAPEDGLAWALQLGLEEREGRRMLTATWITDVDKTPTFAGASMVAMLAPVFMRARESARKTQCLANVKNLSMAVQMYTMDYHRFPRATNWVEAVDEYVKNREVFRCPSDKSTARSSYGMNISLSGKPVSSVKKPAHTVVIYETAHPGEHPAGHATDLAPFRHLGGNNFGYVDGHAKWISGPVPKGEKW